MQPNFRIGYEISSSRSVQLSIKWSPYYPLKYFILDEFYSLLKKIINLGNLYFDSRTNAPPLSVTMHELTGCADSGIGSPHLGKESMFCFCFLIFYNIQVPMEGSFYGLHRGIGIKYFTFSIYSWMQCMRGEKPLQKWQQYKFKNTLSEDTK